MLRLKSTPSSYFFELVIINLWRKAGSPQNFDFNSALALVMNTLANPKGIAVEFAGEFYDTCMSQSHSTPYVIDPVNPYSNVMADYTRWQSVGNCAREFMKRTEMKAVEPGFSH